MIIGFTGTHHGMRKPQRKTVERLLDEHRPEEVHHGDCIGADAEFHEACLFVGCFYGGPIIHIHPPTNPKNRAFCKANPDILVMHLEKPYIERDHNIVDASHVLIATPHLNVEELRSGTWATIRYARKVKLEIWLVQPDGRIIY